MPHRQRIEHERFKNERRSLAEQVGELVDKAIHSEREEDRRNAENAQRKFLEKYHHNWRKFLPNKGREM